MAPGEIFTGLERKWWTASAGPTPELTPSGGTKSPILINHPFYSLDTVVLMNKGIYDRLSPDLQKAMNEVAEELERRHSAFMADRLKKEDQRLKKLGLEFITFSPGDAEKYVKAAYDAGWKDFAEKNAATIKANPGLLEKLQQLGN